MIKHNKFIMGILVFAISTSIISYNAAVRANAQEETPQLYKILTDDRLPMYEAVDKKGITWKYKELSDGTLFIVYAENVQANMEVPSQLNGKDVSVISDIVHYPEYKDYLSDRDRMDKVVQSVKIPSTVKFIESGAFACLNLTDVQLPTTTWVGKGAFESTPWFEKQRDSKGFVIINGRLLDAKNQSGDITIPSNVKEIADSAFYSQENMASVTIPSNVKDIGNGAFSCCRKLKSVIIPNSITEIKPRTFEECNELEDVKIPNSVTKIDEYAFCNCNNLENIKIPDGVTEIGECAFMECSSLKKVNISNKNIQFGFGAFDDDVTMIENGISYNFKDMDKKSLSNENTVNNVNQMPTGNYSSNINSVQQGWHKAGDYWNWLWSNGTKRTGWYTENGEWYYFYGNGQMATEFIDLGGGFSYYLKPGSDGKASMVTGWQYINGDWFYFNPNSDGYKGAMKRACWSYINGKWYYFYYDGTMAHNAYIDGYYVNSSGAWS